MWIYKPKTPKMALIFCVALPTQQMAKTKETQFHDEADTWQKAFIGGRPSSLNYSPKKAQLLSLQLLTRESLSFFYRRKKNNNKKADIHGAENR